MAARLLPQISINEIPHGSERTVARALLEGLGDGWTVFHSCHWLRPDRNLKATALREGEVDFVLVHPEHGFLVVEVKGGVVEYSPDDGLWLQNGKLLRDPFEQARRNMHALVRQIRERAHFETPCMTDKLPCTHGYAVVFPDCNYSGTLPHGAHEGILAGASDLENLGARMRDALSCWPKGTPLPRKDVNQLLGALQSSFRLVEALSSKLDREESQLVQLTEQQAEALEGLYGNRRVLVEGVAGSGKTILALRRALAYAEEGKKTLFLCFNRRLAEFMIGRTQHENLTIRHFHALCRDICMAAHGEFPIPEAEAQQRFWKQDAPELMYLAIDDVPDRQFDAIVVDEAQDFLSTWWDPVEALLREPDGPLYIFFDRMQNLYGSELQFPRTQAVFNLRINCRNTRKVAQACGHVLGKELRVSEHSPEGAKPQVERLSEPKAIREACSAILGRLLGDEKFPPSRIAILSPYTRAKSSLGPGLQWHTVTEKHDEWQEGKGVLFSTIRSFKGLEADVIILVDLAGFREGVFERSELYVAASRAKHRLTVMTDSDEIVEALGVG